MSEINKRIREQMELQGLNKTDLALRSGLARSTVSRYVSDKIEPKQNAIGALAKALGVTPAYLMWGVVDDMEVVDLTQLTEANRVRLLAYYQALVDSQGGGTDGDA